MYLAHYAINTKTPLGLGQLIKTIKIPAPLKHT
jgi:hypothetical protein